MPLRDAVTVETDLFEHRNVQPHFINPCCFGEDFAGWLRDSLAPLATDGFSFSAAIQEDYGWGFWATRTEHRFWIALSYVGDGPQEEPAQWVVSIDESRGLLKRLFGAPGAQAFNLLRDRVRQALAANGAIKVIAS